MNPYLRQDIEEQITEYWRNKWSIVSRELEDVTFDLKYLNIPRDHTFIWGGDFILYITSCGGKPTLCSYPNNYVPINHKNPVLGRYLEDMKTRYKYQGR